jgi:hypothetical protein
MFSFDIKTTIDIEASASEIWQALTELDAYQQWNPMLQNVRSELTPGATVGFEVLREGKKPLKLKARITRADEGAALVWKGGSVALVRGEHYFRIEPLNDGHCRFHHGEHFAGTLIPLLSPTLKKARSQYESMNEALKHRVELPDGSSDAGAA